VYETFPRPALVRMLLVDRRVELRAIALGELLARVPEGAREERRVEVDLPDDGVVAGVFVGERANDGEVRGEVLRGVLAHVGVARDGRSEVVGEALVHRARGSRGAVRVHGPRLELEGVVDHGVTELVHDHVTVVRVVAVRALAEPHGSVGEAVDLSEDRPEATAARREETRSGRARAASPRRPRRRCCRR
jgi:hypothetical protein